jgi:hypothetical protein
VNRIRVALEQANTRASEALGNLAGVVVFHTSSAVRLPPVDDHDVVVYDLVIDLVWPVIYTDPPHITPCLMLRAGPAEATRYPVMSQPVVESFVITDVEHIPQYRGARVAVTIEGPPNLTGDISWQIVGLAHAGSPYVPPED